MCCRFLVCKTYSSSAIVISPTIEEDLDTEDPYAMAPMCANMNRLTFFPLQEDSNGNKSLLPPWHPDCAEDVTPLWPEDASKQGLKGDFHARRKLFFKADQRQAALPASMGFQGNFVNPYLQFQNG